MPKITLDQRHILGAIDKDPANYNSATAENGLVAGRVYWYEGKAYKYVQAEDAAIANGDVLNWANATGTEVTNDRDGSAIGADQCAGVGIGTITDAYYGFILVYGYHSAVKTDGGVAAGESLVPHTVDAQADTMAAGEEDHVFAKALAADTSAGTVPAMVSCL